MTNNPGLQFFIAGMVFPFFVAAGASAIPPPSPRPPIGHEEWQKTGQLPKSLYLQDEDSNHGVIISTPDGGNLAGFNVRDSLNAPNRRELRIAFDDRRFQYGQNGPYVGGNCVFNVGHNDVIPLFDQIYAVDINNAGSKELLLSRVTERVPIAFRPGLYTRSVSTVSPWWPLFGERHPIYENREDYYEASVEFKEGSKKATVRLEPGVGVYGKVPPEGRPPVLPARRPIKLEVEKGDFLTYGRRSHMVVNVVPPQDIKDVGHLVGWIELAADPEPPSP